MARSPKAVSYPDDFSSVTYRLRPQAKFHDGRPVTAEDVIFSLDAFKKISPATFRLLQPCGEGREERRPRSQVHLRCAGQPRIAADRRTDQRAAEALVGGHRQSRPKRDISATSLEPPLGNGAYRIKEFVPARSIVYERVKDYWGRDLPAISVATISTSCASNISAIRPVALEAFKAISWTGARRTAPRDWATAYDFPAVPRSASDRGISDPQSGHHAGLSP